jgi:hypothetical protein
MVSGDIPAAARVGVRLYLVSLAAGLLKFLVPGWGSLSIADTDAPDFASDLFVGLLVFAVMLWLLLMIQRRKNWARIALGISFGLGVLMSPWALRPQYSAGLISGLLTSIGCALQAIATILLFLPSSNRWFRGPSAMPGNS